MRKKLPSAVLVPALLGLFLLAMPAQAAPGDPAKGKFLVADRGLLDPNFAETVILLLDYDEGGAMGVVINLPTELKVASVLSELEPLAETEACVYVGGPVALSQMLLLVRVDQPPDESLHVFEDVYLSTSRVLLDRLGRGDAEALGFRVFAGHSGWAPGQLDAEIGRGDWHVLPAEADLVFDEDTDSLWGDLIERSDVQWASRADSESGPVTPRAAAVR